MKSRKSGKLTLRIQSWRGLIHVDWCFVMRGSGRRDFRSSSIRHHCHLNFVGGIWKKRPTTLQICRTSFSQRVFPRETLSVCADKSMMWIAICKGKVTVLWVIRLARVRFVRARFTLQHRRLTINRGSFQGCRFSCSCRRHGCELASGRMQGVSVKRSFEGLCAQSVT